MGKNNSNKKVLIAACLFLFLLSAAFCLQYSLSAASPFQSVDSTAYQRDAEVDPKSNHDEPLYTSIFKFIVDCNPFKKQAE